MRNLIARGNDGEYRTRLEADFAACLALFGAGYDGAEVWAVITDPHNGISEKFRDKGCGGERYLALTIAKAESRVEASPRRRLTRSKARRVRRRTRG